MDIISPEAINHPSRKKFKPVGTSTKTSWDAAFQTNLILKVPHATIGKMAIKPHVRTPRVMAIQHTSAMCSYNHRIILCPAWEEGPSIIEDVWRPR